MYYKKLLKYKITVITVNVIQDRSKLKTEYVPYQSILKELMTCVVQLSISSRYNNDI